MDGWMVDGRSYATDDILMNGNLVTAVGCAASTHAQCLLGGSASWLSGYCVAQRELRIGCRQFKRSITSLKIMNVTVYCKTFQL